MELTTELKSGLSRIDGVIVTGAAGFIGSHLCELFLTAGKTVIGVDNFATGQRANAEFLKALPRASERFTFITADVSEPWETWLKPLPEAVKKQITHVLHFASPASPPHYQRLGLETMRVNSVGTEYAIKAADSFGAKALFASTSEVYGDPSFSPQPESYWGNVNSYGVRSCYDEAKRYGESWIFTSNKKNNTRHGVIRIFNTYGPRMNPNDGRVIINFLVQAFKNQPITMYGTGQQTRSFCYVDNLVAGIVGYLGNDLVGPVNLGNEKEFSMLELSEVVKKIFPDRKLEVKFAELPADDPKQRRPDLTRARELIPGWSPDIQLLEGLERMKSWLVANPAVLKEWAS